MERERGQGGQVGCGSNVCCLGPGCSAPPPPRSPFPPLLGAPQTTPLLSITSTGTPSLHEGHFSFRDSAQLLELRVKRNITRLRLTSIFRFCVVCLPHSLVFPDGLWQSLEATSRDNVDTVHCRHIARQKMLKVHLRRWR